MTEKQKIENCVNYAKTIFSLISQRDSLNNQITNDLARLQKQGYTIGEDENGKFLQRILKRKIDKIYLS